MHNMWVVRAGREAALFKDFEQGSYVAIGAKEIGGIPPATSADELERLLTAALPDVKPGTISSWVSQYYRFAHELQIDDEVVTYGREDQSFLVGRILSDTEVRPDLPLPWIRRTQWTHRVPRESLSQSTRNTLGAIQSLFRLNETAAQELRQRGDIVATPEYRRKAASEFWAICGRMLDVYPNRPLALSADTEPVRLRRELQVSLETLVRVLVPNSHWRVGASVGQGNWVTVPWCAVYDTRETTSAQRGTYPAIAFRTEPVPSLRLAWGASWTEYKDASQHRAVEIANTLPAEAVAALRQRSFHIATNADTNTIPDDEGEGMIAAKLVPRAELDSGVDELTDDLQWLLEAYKSWVDHSSTPPVADAIAEPSGVSPSQQQRTYTIDWLADETQLNAEILQDLVDALTTRTPQIILAGPPGTSKTWVAQKLSEYLTQGDNTHQHIVQFHPSYSYEEFVEGLRPTAAGGAIQFEAVPGHLLRVVRDMNTQPGRHVMVLDEINRANLPRVLGELLYLLEYRDRTIDLQYSRGFSLPARLLFIGTMNTADRSIRTLDAALRRRFEVFECMPDADVLGAYYETRPNTVPDLIEGFTALNDALTKRLDRHHTVGHAFVMAPEMTPQRLLKTWKYKIGPLVEEYFFDQPSVLEEFAPTKFWSSLGSIA
jgi:hypothetical protein